MKAVVLSDGKETFVDDEDYFFISCFNWWPLTASSGCNFYAVSQQWDKKLQKNNRIFLHHLILPRKKGFDTDHIDRNGLNNVRSNLRYATRSQNMANRQWTKSNSATGYRGVYRMGKKFQAQIRVNGRIISLGYFDSAIAAFEAYQKGSLRYFGEFSIYGGWRG